MRCRGLSNSFRALLLVALSLQAQADFHQDVLIVELRFNGQPFGEAFVLTDADGNYYVEDSWLRRWEVVRPYPESREFSGKNYYAISDFQGATATLISQQMILDVTMPPDLLPLRIVDMRGDYRLKPTANYGAYMDYDWNYRQQSSASLQTFSSLIRPVLFGPKGNLLANLLYRKVSGDSAGIFDRQTNGLTVLDLTYTYDDPDKLRSLRVGDVITAAGALGRSLRLGGIQFATNFATQPTLITFPLPSFYGQTAVPTTLDIYVNGQLRRRQEVAAGNFILEDIPVVNGAGQMQIMTEDALGRQQMFVQDFYVSTELLREGLNDYSFNLGAMREAYGLENFQYGDIAGSATWRHGLRDDLTLEGHLEFTDGLGVIAAASQFQPTAGGILSTGLGVSTGRDGTGGGSGLSVTARRTVSSATTSAYQELQAILHSSVLCSHCLRCNFSRAAALTRRFAAQSVRLSPTRISGGGPTAPSSASIIQHSSRTDSQYRPLLLTSTPSETILHSAFVSRSRLAMSTPSVAACRRAGTTRRCKWMYAAVCQSVQATAITFH